MCNGTWFWTSSMSLWPEGCVVHGPSYVSVLLGTVIYPVVVVVLCVCGYVGVMPTAALWRAGRCLLSLLSSWSTVPGADSTDSGERESNSLVMSSPLSEPCVQVVFPWATDCQATLKEPSSLTEVETPSINCESLEITVCCEPCHWRPLPVGLMCSSRQACGVEHLMHMHIHTFL